MYILINKIGVSFESLFQADPKEENFGDGEILEGIGQKSCREVSSTIVVSRRGIESIYRRRHRENPLNGGSSVK